MEKKRLIVVAYTILGCIVGYMTFHITNFLTLFSLVLGIYFVTVIPLSRKLTMDKLLKWLASNTFLVYIMVWLVVFILLNNALG